MNITNFTHGRSAAKSVTQADQRRAWSDLCNDMNHVDHSIDTTSPLPEIKPLSGRSPNAPLIAAVVDGDVEALRCELGRDSSPLNDPIVGTRGKSLLHLAACLHGIKSKKRLNSASAYNEVCEILLAAGADPLARDAIKQFPSSYTDGFTPACLRDRMLRAAAQCQVGWQEARVEARCRVNATHPWAGNGKGRLTREAKERGSRAGFRA